MKKFGKVVVKLRIPILVLSFLLLIPSVLGYFNTRVNYDILYYLPSDIDTMQGQDILLDDFGKGAYAMVVVDGMNKSNVSKLVKKVEGVDHVASVISYSGMVGDDVPSEILPDKFRSYFEFSVLYLNFCSLSEFLLFIRSSVPYFSFQMSLLYSMMVLSDEKKPAFAMLTSIIFCHFLRSS